MKLKLVFALLAIAAAIPCSVSADEAGRYQAVSGEYMLRDYSGKGPGVWLIDTKYGRVSFCNAQPDVKLKVACTAFTVPEPGPWDKYQKQEQ